MRSEGQGANRFGRIGFWFDAFLVVGGTSIGLLFLSVAGVLKPGPVSNAVLLPLVLVMGILLVALSFARKRKLAESHDTGQQTPFEK